MLVLINKNSGGGTAIKKWERIQKHLIILNSQYISIINTDQSIDQLILDSFNNGNTDFVVAGGDGTINFFLNRCMKLFKTEILRNIKIGAVGIGSSNDFQKPFSPENIIDGIPYRLNFKDAVCRDVGCLIYKSNGMLDKKYFLINASVGITAEGNNSFNNPDYTLRYLKQLNTQTAITYAAVKNIFTYNNFTATVKINGESFNAEVSNMGIIKSPYFTGTLRYQSNPKLDDGLFDVHLYQSLSRFELLKLFNNLSKGLPDKKFNRKIWKANKIKISSEEEFAVEFDGEVIKTKWVEFSIIPRLIKVCVN